MVTAGYAAIRICKRIPACNKKLKELIDKCKKIRCKLQKDPPHHRVFPGKIGWCEHYRFFCYIKGKKDSTFFELQLVAGHHKCFERKWGRGKQTNNPPRELPK